MLISELRNEKCLPAPRPIKLRSKSRISPNQTLQLVLVDIRITETIFFDVTFHTKSWYTNLQIVLGPNLFRSSGFEVSTRPLAYISQKMKILNSWTEHHEYENVFDLQIIYSIRK